jgi:citrate lyase beta subunit
MRLVYDDAVRAREFGMLGKWVGHPAQLFAVLLAYEAGLTDASLEHEAAKLEAYDAAVASDRGATMIAGVMSDRATDRHARAVLRQATAMGRFDPARSVALGVISEAEAAEASRAFASHRAGAEG